MLKINDKAVITSWIKGEIELHVLKHPPDHKLPTSFSIIGRSSKDQKYDTFGKRKTGFIETHQIFEHLKIKTAKKFKVKL